VVSCIYPTLHSKPTKHFSSEYYCNKCCLLGTPILHAEFLSTVQWDFWQELARSIWSLSIRQRCTADGRKYCALTLRGCLMMCGRYLEISKHHSQFGPFQRNYMKVHQMKCYGNEFNEVFCYLFTFSEVSI